MTFFKKWGSTIIIAAVIIVQTTLLKNVRLAGAKPDFALILLIFFANHRGRMEGQLLGFLSGILEDLLSLSPLGFTMLIKTVAGYIFGLTKGKIFVDPILMPIVLAAAGTLLKILLSFILAAIFLDESMIQMVFGEKVWIALGFNALLAPFIFGFMKIFKIYKVRQERF